MGSMKSVTVPRKSAVDQVADRAAEHQRQRRLVEAVAGRGGAQEDQHDHGAEDRAGDQERASVLQDPERGPGVLHVRDADQIEALGPGLALAQPGAHERLRQLVEDHHRRGDAGEAPELPAQRARACGVLVRSGRGDGLLHASILSKGAVAVRSPSPLSVHPLRWL